MKGEDSVIFSKLENYMAAFERQMEHEIYHFLLAHPGKTIDDIEIVVETVPGITHTTDKTSLFGKRQRYIVRLKEGECDE